MSAQFHVGSQALNRAEQESPMNKEGYAIGMVGLGVMGRNLLLNMADHGYPVAGYDLDISKVAALRAEAQGRAVRAVESLKEFIDSLQAPRAVMMLVPAGPPVDHVIQGLVAHLSTGDVIIDGGNSHFKDTERRQKTLAEKGISFLGVGISGGESGAMHGPSIMPGGDREAYERVRPILEAVAAKVDGEPCIGYMGPNGAGHYVKMVHNGIEYGLMQLIAETYDLMKRGLNLSNDDLHTIYTEWSKGELNSFLVEITAHIFSMVDTKTGERLIDLILDQAGQKGTGMWTSQSAIELQTPLPTIDMAVAIRDLSGLKDERIAAGNMLAWMPPLLEDQQQNQPERVIAQLKNALYLGMLITYAQGMALLRSASAAYKYALDLAEVARIWRGGCIIRAGLLEKVRATYRDQPAIANILMDPRLAQEVTKRQQDLRAIVCTAAASSIPAPGMMASLSYLDAYRSGWLPANLIQAQRDYFGAHTYERVDEPGIFHTQWTRE
jgi:6-phosphogluconate dehydrogenase